MDSTLGSRPRHDPRFEKGAESLVNDLGKDRSVVPSRAAASLRSAESHLQVRRICSFNRVFFLHVSPDGREPLFSFHAVSPPAGSTRTFPGGHSGEKLSQASCFGLYIL